MVDYRIDTFLTLCEVMNYRETAELLHISQPAVTQHIQFLEREYGCRLFLYENRRLQKTEEAQLLEDYARAMRKRDLDMRHKLTGGRECVQELCVGATKTIGDYVIGEQVRRYLSKQKHTLTLIVENTEYLLKMIEENKLDFAIIEGFFDKRHFDSQLWRREPFVGICRKGHPFAGREIEMDELLTETIIHREEGSGTRAILEQKLKCYNESFYRFKDRICISTFKIILDLVKRGFGISFVYRILAESDPDIDTFNIKGEMMVREFNIVYLKYAAVQDKIDQFFER